LQALTYSPDWMLLTNILKPLIFIFSWFWPEKKNVYHHFNWILWIDMKIKMFKEHTTCV
jgi:hypothetical protein